MKRLFFIAAGKPTFDAALGKARPSDQGLTKEGRRQVKRALEYLKLPEWLITSNEPDTRESARIMLGEEFAHRALFLPELSIDFTRPKDRPIALWKLFQDDSLRSCQKPVAVLVRSGLINQMVTQFCVNYPNFERIQELMDRTFFDFGSAVCIDLGARPRVTLYN